ncbi:tudor and KH domain-containing protein isoform X2 [Eublepharis macularius]|uniref:Tudor and KH domain-containing protein isoform X2 n=1 Tax=Eublepharis macularius TaxID=481883 RepID=A0AA97J0V3_EUBMA|nr:tudor and KH domain-containing protein isoform X2 [Eublepharis macularius]
MISLLSFSDGELQLRKFLPSPLRPPSALEGGMSSERSSWGSLTTLQKVAVALGIPASGAILYILYRRYRESREERLTFVGDEEIEMEMKVPKDAVRLLIGRQGANIKQLRKDTRARIDLDVEESSEDRTIRICGSPVQVCKAKAAIHQLLAENSPVEEKMYVPQGAVGRIIGRGGETVRSICRSTGAKVLCDRQGDGVFSLTRLITISGTPKEVKAAKALIMEKLSENEAFQKKLAQLASCQPLRKHPVGRRKEEGAGDQAGPHPHIGEAPSWLPCPSQKERDAETNQAEYPLDEPQELRSENDTPEDSLSGTSWPSSTFEVPSPDFSFHANEHLEVYISASENPNHFWIQMIGSRTFQLNKLHEEMTQYYESSGCVDGLPNVHVDDIVAAPYQYDGTWYRARVLGTLENGNLDLYYVDYGDNGEAPLEKLRALRSDFLSLPFQAIECSLAGIAPAGGQWEEAALDEFDCLTQCGKWQPIVAKIASYVPSGSNTWPHVHLYSISGKQNIDIGEELIRLGYAVQCPLEEGAAVGDGLHQARHGAVPGDSHPNQGNMEEMSLESLNSDMPKTPDEMPLTLSCLSLSGTKDPKW